MKLDGWQCSSDVGGLLITSETAGVHMAILHAAVSPAPGGRRVMTATLLWARGHAELSSSIISFNPPVIPTTGVQTLR